MNKIKSWSQINEGSVISFTIVDFTGGGDGVYALYIDGRLHKYGDYYHDKIENYIAAFIDGVSWTGAKINKRTLKITDERQIERISEMGDSPPKNLDEIEFLPGYKQIK